MSGNTIILAMILGAPTLKPPSPTEVGLVGHWQVREAIHEGKATRLPPGVIVHVFEPDWQCYGGDVKLGPSFRAHYSIDPASSPMRIDWISKSPKGKSLVQKGFFKIEGDTLTLCLAANDKGERPTKFESTKDPPTWLYVYKRFKKKD